MLLHLSVRHIRIVGRAHQMAKAFGHRKAAAYMFKRGIDFATAYAVLFNRKPTL